MRSDDGNIEEFFVSLITGLMGLMLIALWLEPISKLLGGVDRL